MRVLLIATNRHQQLLSRMVARPVPIGLAYVAGYLDPQRHPVKLLDLMFSEDYLADVRQAVQDFRPDLVGISLRNLDNSSYIDPQWALPITREVIQTVRQCSKAPVVCGGPAFSLFPKECFRYLEPDLGIAGDGGESFARLADSLEAGEQYHNLPGLVYNHQDGHIVSNGLAYSSFSASPRLEELDMPSYNRAGFGIGVVTKLDDSFANSMESAGNPESWRVIRPVEDVVQEVKELKQAFQVRKVFFIDSAFNLPPVHAEALCRALIDADLGVRWNSYLAPVDQACHEELLHLMTRAGCALMIMNSFDVADNGGAELARRLDGLRDICHRCEKAGVHYMVSQVFGEPGDTAETVEQKLEFLRQITPAIANLRVGQRLRPGSPLVPQALSEGLISDEADLVRPVFYISPEIKEWIVDRLTGEAAEQPRWNLV